MCGRHGDIEVSARREFVEVMAGDVWMHGTLVGGLCSGHPVAARPGVQIDTSSGRITEHRGSGRDRGREMLSGRLWRWWRDNRGPGRRRRADPNRGPELETEGSHLGGRSGRCRHASSVPVVPSLRVAERSSPRNSLICPSPKPKSSPHWVRFASPN